MLRKELVHTEEDLESIKKLVNFLPDKIFDAHSHLLDTEFLPQTEARLPERLILDIEQYRKEMMPILGNPGKLRLNIITFPEKSMKARNPEQIRKADEFLVRQLQLNPENAGEIIVHPKETAEDIEKRLVHPNIRGFKCYHLLADRDNSWNADIGEYLSEAAWEVANRHKLCITLHLVKNDALADEGNMEYICKMTKKYPDAVLILAHAARSFAAWTGIESVEKLAHIENVWFDFSSVCESPAMLQIMKKAGAERCMWGSDYPICREHGKVVSVGDGFHWIYESDYKNSKVKPDKLWLIGIENLMAVRQACILADLPESKIEDLFYNNAVRLFG